VLNLADYPWTYSLASLPDSPAVERGPRNGDDDFLLRVTRPPEGASPEEDQALALFLELFALFNRFEREGDSLQLFVADGVLVCEASDEDERDIHHPLLLQRLDLSFDASIPAFTLRDASHSPMLYAPMLRNLGIDGKNMVQLQAEFSDKLCHPLGGAEVDDFLRRLIQGLWPDGGFFQSRSEAADARPPHLYRDPMLVLGHRNQDYATAIDRYLDTLQSTKEIPRALRLLVGIEDQLELEADAPAPTELLLTRPANPQQERVIQRLEETGAVLVQGPPGTGKSHTIANLIGHFLAQKKTILVTSHASKALRVVREQVAEPLRSLCVSVLDSDELGAKQLEESVTGILNYFSETTLDTVREEIAELQEARKGLIDRRDELMRTLERAVRTEYEPLCIEGNEIDIASVAQELAEARSEHSWIPGPVDIHQDLPIEPDDVGELYQLCGRWRGQSLKDDELEISPAVLAHLPEPAQFSNHCNARTRALSPTARESAALWQSEEQTEQQLDELAASVTAAAEVIQRPAPWLDRIVEAGLSGRETQASWHTFLELIADCSRRIPPRQKILIERGPRIQLSMPLSESLSVCNEIVDHLATGKKLRRVATLFKSSWSDFVAGCQLDSGPPETLAHFQALQAALQISSMRENLKLRWNRQMVPIGGPLADDLGLEPERGAAEHAKLIRAALAWGSEHLHPCELALHAAGLRWADVAGSTVERAATYRTLFTSELPELIEARRGFIKARRLDAQRLQWAEALSDQQAPAAARLAEALRTGARERYTQIWRGLRGQEQRNPEIRRRDELLARIEPFAPVWAEELRNADGLKELTAEHDPDKAWQYRRWSQLLTDKTKVDVDAIQAELHAVTAKLQDKTARFVEMLSWEAQFERTGLEQQQALAGWLALHKKLGKGKGKNAARLKEEAKKTLRSMSSSSMRPVNATSWVWCPSPWRARWPWSAITNRSALMQSATRSRKSRA
jgi:DNA polymerase III delta prime subunit